MFARFIPFYSRFILLLLAVGFYLCLGAQQVVWANKNNLDKKTNFTKVIGQNQHGVFVLKHKNSSFKKYFIVEHFDKKMNLLRNKMFKINNAQLEKIIVNNDGFVFFVKNFDKNNVKRLSMHFVDSSLNEIKKIDIHQTGINAFTPLYKIYYNTDKTLYMIASVSDSANQSVLQYHLVKNQDIQVQGRFILPYAFDELYIGDGCIDNSGQLFFLISQSQKFKSKNASDFFHYVMAFNPYTLNFQSQLINNEKTYLSNYQLVYNYQTNKVQACGFYGENYEDENLGYFIISILPTTLKPEHIVFKQIERSIVAQIIGVKSESKGENLNKFDIKKMIPKANGGLIMISERAFVTTQSDIFYINGVPQSSYAKIFNNDEVLIISLDSLFQPQWTDVVNKTQSSINDGGFYNGIITMVNDDEFNILYNDRISANADIVQISYNEFGRMTKKIILNNDQYYALLIPAESKQVNANSIVIPVNQNRDFTYIKLIY